MAAVIDLITDAMIGSTIKGSDEVISTDDANICLRRLKRMLDSWSNEPLLVFETSDESFVMTASLADYSTSLLASGRPVSFDSCYVEQSNINYPVDIVDEQTFNAIPYRIVDAIPTVCYYDASMPNGVFHFYPRPYAPFVCHIISRRVLVGPLTLAAQIVLPPGYEKAIVDSLAADIWTSFKGSAPIPPDVKAMAREAQSVLRLTNAFPLEMTSIADRDWGNISNAFLYKGF